MPKVRDKSKCKHPERSCKWCFTCEQDMDELPMEKWIEKRIEYYTSEMKSGFGGYPIIEELKLVLAHHNQLKDKND